MTTLTKTRSTKVTVDQRTKIALRYERALVIGPGIYDEANYPAVATVLADIMQLGFVMSKDLLDRMASLPIDDIVRFHENLVAELRSLKGADVVYSPMYPNFPEQVMEMSHFELFLNAISHYWTQGEWMPDYDKLPREFAFENIQFKTLGLIDEDGFNAIFTRLLASNDSISDADKTVVEWFLDNVDGLTYPDKIPFKENICLVASLLFDRGHEIDGLIRTATDVLRVATHLSGGDISLADKTKFKSFPRKTRRVLTSNLERVISEEDINRHRNKWIRLFHTLHVGENKAINPKTFTVATKIRGNERIKTFNSLVQHAIDTKDIKKAVALLSKRPGEFARRIDHLIRISERKKSFIIDSFLKVAEGVPTRVLLQLLGNLQIRGEDTTKRIAFPKGNTQRAVVLRQELPKIGRLYITKLQGVIKEILGDRFSSQKELGKVWIDPDLMDCPVPSQQRSASEGLLQVARGTRLPIGDKDTLRLFIYWKGQDIDLSATMHDESFKMIERIAYTNLKSATYEACHSGDITSARDGASEFIDITIDKAVKSGIRYIAMNVLVFTGPSFKEHNTVYAGWMTRSKPMSNEIYDPKTVEQKIDLGSDSRNAVPVIFDLVDRKAIWVDLTSPPRWSSEGSFGRWGTSCNNVETNRATVEETIEAMVSMANKVSLYELFEIHARSRGEIVKNREDADVVFSLFEGDITPFNIDVINAEYLA